MVDNMNNYNIECLTIPKDVCKYYHDHLEHYMYIYSSGCNYSTEEVHAISVLEALVLLLGEPLIDRHHDPVIHPVQLKLNL